MLPPQHEFRELRALRREEIVSSKWYNDFRAEEKVERQGRWDMAEAEGETRSFLWEEGERDRLQRLAGWRWKDRYGQRESMKWFLMWFYDVVYPNSCATSCAITPGFSLMSHTDVSHHCLHT